MFWGCNDMQLDVIISVEVKERKSQHHARYHHIITKRVP